MSGLSAVNFIVILEPSRQQSDYGLSIRQDRQLSIIAFEGFDERKLPRPDRGTAANQRRSSSSCALRSAERRKVGTRLPLVAHTPTIETFRSRAFLNSHAGHFPHPYPQSCESSRSP